MYIPNLNCFCSNAFLMLYDCHIRSGQIENHTVKKITCMQTGLFFFSSNFTEFYLVN